MPDDDPPLENRKIRAESVQNIGRSMENAVEIKYVQLLRFLRLLLPAF